VQSNKATPKYDFSVMWVNRVIDGDTLDVLVDVGFRTSSVQRIRLANVDTPERGLPGYYEATKYLNDWVTVHRQLRVATYVEDSFCRWVADLYDVLTGESASSALLQAGLAEVWKR
jgi:micrococcal nuclease